MTKRLSVRDVRANLSDVLAGVYYTKEPVIVERKGRPMAVMVSPEQYEALRRQVMDRFREAMDELQRRNADKDPAEIEREITALVEEVRSERYERSLQAQTDPRDD
jgi:prevent-host-death family protein